MRFALLLVSFLSLPSISYADSGACFEASAARWNIPARALRAIAKFQTGGFHNIPDAHDDHGHRHLKTYGVMGFHDDEVLGHSLVEAQLASGLSREDIIRDPCANIDAAAALLSAELARNGGNLDEALKKYWAGAASGSLSELKALMAGNVFNLKVRLADDPVAGLCWRFWTDCGKPNPPVNPDQGEEEPEPAPKGNGGEYPGADFQASPNFGGGIKQLYIVLHTTEGNFDGAVSWLSSPKSGVSSHYVVRNRDGYVKQLVRENNRAFHARCWNSMAIGIEMEGFSKDSSSLSNSLIRSVASISKYLTRKYGISPTEARIVGHDAAERGKIGGTGLNNCNDHGDPGVSFNWSLFWRLLGN